MLRGRPAAGRGRPHNGGRGELGPRPGAAARSGPRAGAALGGGARRGAARWRRSTGRGGSARESLGPRRTHTRAAILTSSLPFPLPAPPPCAAPGPAGAGRPPTPLQGRHSLARQTPSGSDSLRALRIGRRFTERGGVRRALRQGHVVSRRSGSAHSPRRRRAGRGAGLGCLGWGECGRL